MGHQVVSQGPVRGIHRVTKDQPGVTKDQPGVTRVRTGVTRASRYILVRKSKYYQLTDLLVYMCKISSNSKKKAET